MSNRACEGQQICSCGTNESSARMWWEYEILPGLWSRFFDVFRGALLEVMLASPIKNLLLIVLGSLIAFDVAEIQLKASLFSSQV